jgi:hypothetical protein
MNPRTIEQYPDDYPIFRFLNKDGLMHTLGMKTNLIPRQRIDMNPTFLLRSLDHYRALESHRGDQHENEIVTLHPTSGVPLSNRNLNPILVSCWSHYSLQDLHTNAPWSVFKETCAVIESTAGDIKKILGYLAPLRSENETEVKHEGNWGSLRADFNEHGKVIYYSPSEHEIIYSQPILSNNCFYKRRDPYSKENEYRFMVMFSNHLNFAPEMFAARLKQTDYLKQIHLKQENFSKEELTQINAYYSSLLI